MRSGHDVARLSVRASDPVRYALASIVAALLSFWTVIYLARHEPLLVPQLAISAIVVSMSLVRSDERRARARGAGVGAGAEAGAGRRMLPERLVDLALRVVLIPVVALVALLIGRLVGHHAALGFALISIPLVAGVWLRRFGPIGSRIGTLVTFPFVAAIVTPVAAVPGQHGASGVWWGALAALVAVGWAAVLGFLLTPELPRRLAVYTAAPRPAAPDDETKGDEAGGDDADGDEAGADETVDVPAPRRDGVDAPPAVRRRLVASDRMAIHLALSLAAAIALGWWLLPDHLAWVVLTAYVVNSGNRGRADVVYKGVLRTVGALAGTVVATLVGALFAPHDSAAIALVFVVLAIGAVLRTRSYAWWAAAMTGALALLYGYLGESSPSLLGLRLVAIVLGGAIAIAASSFVLPVRSVDVLRKRSGEALRAAAAWLREPGVEPAERHGRLHAVLQAIDKVDELHPALHAERMLVFGRLARLSAPAELLDAVVGLRGPLQLYADEPSRPLAAELRTRLGAVREQIAALGPRSSR